ncbi:hypothetical protein MSAS_14510 [Mycobacterium saskatchewanense]|uniref:hypothetical protein n=1 Tax=Mycobacterium saskatchewanense TaxID=220927 RepID=UPI0011543ADC|nr:hypothetical protein [Mycobacterium saskatchewanense]BBX62277.1 hypothetical protein MSAS_14510 [Mycobacterium saskatchewanense]
MGRIPVGRRSIDVRVAFAALAIVAMASAPVVAFAESIHPVKTTVNADPDSDYEWYYVPEGGGGGGGG